MARLLCALLCAILCSGAMAQQTKLRGMWVDVFHDGIKSPFQVRELIQRAKRAGVNALFIQVRSRAQTYHSSAYEHRALDAFPFFDGLAAVIREAHASNPPIQVHAWLNAHPLWSESSLPVWEDHILYRRPDWLTQDPYGNRGTPVGYALDFGHPEVQDYLTRLYLEVVRKYDVDGIHFDFIRFGGSEWGYNQVSVARFLSSLSAEQRAGVLARAERASLLTQQTTRGTSGGSTRELFPGANGTPSATNPHPANLPTPDDPLFSDWRRKQVTDLVRRVTLLAKELKPNLVVSAAVVPWGDAPATFEESAAYRRCFQDWRAWAREGILDLLIPMLYFRETQHGEWFRNWVRYCEQLKGGRTRIIAGIGNWLNSHDDTLKQAKYADSRLDGVCFFSYASTNPMPGVEAELFNESFYDRLGELPPALPPPARPLPPMKYGFLVYPQASEASETFHSAPATQHKREDRPAGGLPSARDLKESRKVQGSHILIGVEVLASVGAAVKVTDGKDEATLELRTFPDLPLLPRDRLAVTGKWEDEVFKVESFQWLGVARRDPLLLGTQQRPW
jgi:uncharacterized lipoprotein YddW (UPF0748 family)